MAVLSRVGLILGLVFVSQVAMAFGPLCERYMGNARDVAALETVSRNMQYSPEQLCALPHALDIQITHTMLTDEDQRSVPHTWLTVHYNEYSCQYFVRDSDQSVTKKNCYNTF